MAIEALSYRQLAERFGCSRDAARAWVKQLRLPCHIANDGRAVVSVDLSETNHRTTPTPSPTGHNSVTASGKEHIEPKLEATAADRRQADLERERERAERLMAELLRAKADALAARATVVRLEGELAALRSRPWWRFLTWRKRQPKADPVLSASETHVQKAALAGF
jgi:hypothetical protein